MPIYEYACRACGAQTEIMQRLSDPPAKKCPVCGKSKLTKQISAAGFRLSGGGWYETDFKKDGKRNIAGDKAETAPATAPAVATDTKKLDVKPDASAKPDKADKPKPGKKKVAAAA